MEYNLKAETLVWPQDWQLFLYDYYIERKWSFETFTLLFSFVSQFPFPYTNTGL